MDTGVGALARSRWAWSMLRMAACICPVFLRHLGLLGLLTSSTVKLCPCQGTVEETEEGLEEEEEENRMGQ